MNRLYYATKYYNFVAFLFAKNNYRQNKYNLMLKILDCWINLCYFIFEDGKYDVKMNEVHILSILKEINLVSNPARLKIIIMLGTTAKTAQDLLDALWVSGLKYIII